MADLAALTITDLGIPTILGAVGGALIAHFAAKERGREDHERTLDLLVVQDERRAAQRVLETAQSIGRQVNGATDQLRYGQLHNQWSDGVLSPARLIRDEEINRRARTGAYMIFLGTLMKDEENPVYAVGRAALDVEDWGEAWLKGEAPPPAHLPDMKEIGTMVRSGSPGTLSMEALGDHLVERAEQLES